MIIHNYHLERIAAGLDGREIPEPRWYDGPCVFWRDGAPCESETAEMLVPIHGDGQPAYPVCSDHLREHLQGQLLPDPWHGHTEDTEETSA